MRRSLLRNASLCTRYLLHPSPHPNPTIPNSFRASLAASSRPTLRFYSDSSNKTPPDSVPESSALAELTKKDDSVEVRDVSNKELREMMDIYFKGDDEVLPDIMEAVLLRRLSGKHEETDEELLEELRMKPLDDVKDEEFESGFAELHETDKELDDLYDAKEHVVKKMMKDEFFNMDDKKWDGMVKEAMDHGFIKDTKECEAILEDMLNWDKLLPDDIKKKVEKKFNELGDMCERKELEAEEAYEMFKKFEDEIVMEYVKKMEAEVPPQLDEAAVADKKKHLDDPPGEGPILRWQTRVVFSPGGDAWHPKNRKVKMSVTVKELGLSKPQFRRLRELVGKRYHPGRDELTITSERLWVQLASDLASSISAFYRFEHREENRKDCLRTLFSLIEEAGKATKLAEEARVSYCKDRLRANPAFVERLRSKIIRQECNTVSA
ncbi:unnamed protein product [Dovyalis caffra]|uniref:Small ribosomal subunit protein mS35 mitochondrial conserved domain-containing protein n=1 Tax=Dovyalis caffra TaxID=77055 RepID=A0AAV1SFW8_9ROSI|nr:unnamed protein product [Dovyalis caffra]